MPVNNPERVRERITSYIEYQKITNPVAIAGRLCGESAIDIDDMDELIEFIETVKADIENGGTGGGTDKTENDESSAHDTESIVEAANQGADSWSSSSTDDKTTADTVSPDTGSDDDMETRDESATKVTPASQGETSFNAN